MARYMVTGAAGFLGSHLTDQLLNAGHSVVGLDNLCTGRAANWSHLTGQSRFLGQTQDISHTIPDVGPVEGVFHLASPASPTDFMDLAIEIMKVGSLGTLNALEYARKHQAWFFMASTSEVYGDPLVHPQAESYLGNVNPNGVRGVYDESKRFSEALVSAFRRKHGLATSIVRIFNTYGPRMRANDGRVVSTFIRQALANEPLTVQGDGAQTRSFCYVDDLVRGFLAFAERRPAGPINLGNDAEVTVLEVAKKVLAMLPESKSEIQFRALPQDDPKRRRPDITRAKQELGWAPQISFDEGLKKTIDYFKSPL